MEEGAAVRLSEGVSQLKEAKRNRICRHGRQRHLGEAWLTDDLRSHWSVPCFRAVLAPFSGHVVRCFGTAICEREPLPSSLPLIDPGAAVGRLASARHVAAPE